MDTQNPTPPAGDATPEPRGTVPTAAPEPADAPTHHTVPAWRQRDPLDRDEREIKDNVLRLGSMVSDQVLRAIEALERHDPEIALSVIISDGRLNEAQRLITALVARTIATQQPVARDLRFMLALDHVAYDLERMGDGRTDTAPVQHHQHQFRQTWDRGDHPRAAATGAVAHRAA